MKIKTNLRITEGKGFQLSFENGLTISVQFGEFNYCANRNKELSQRDVTCTSAEIAIFEASSDKWLTNKFLPKKAGVDVVGWLAPDEIGKLIGRVQRYKPK